MRQEPELAVAERKMLKFSLGLTRIDGIRNESTRGTAPCKYFGEKFRETD